ncbi:MAG TPA: TIGR03435 family protein [Acidobacteriaceae bacterium]|jgi:bla regulator protein BlaR1|nr:TIGR03435 family protein [Acidobacteriaceae bacterium]
MARNVVASSKYRFFGLLIVGILIASSRPLSQCQTGSATPEAAMSATPPPLQQAPAYEVTTVKPPGPTDYAMPLHQYIQTAFGLPGNATGLVFGPAWVNSATYVIRGKPPDSIRDAMKAMNRVERSKDEDLMMQALLADRFKMKAHLETRVMPVYDLVVAKGGPKLTENSDASKGMAMIGSSRFRATALPIAQLCSLLEVVPDIGGRVIVDKTGLTGAYDLNLKWTPLQAAAPGGGESGTSSSPDAGGASFFTAIEEQLGLKLVPTKGPAQVVVIDHIERPSEN